MTDTLRNAGGNTKASVPLSHKERAAVSKPNGAQDDTEEMYPLELMPVGDPRPQSK